MPGDPESSCLDESVVLALVAGELDPTQLARVDAHLARCEDCLQIVGVAAGAERSFSAEAPPVTGPEPRTTLLDGFEFVSFIAEGGMGEVYAGVSRQTGQRVAIKRLKTSGSGRDVELVARFTREGEVLRRLNHPNIVQVLGVFHEGDQHHIVMEYVSGGSLRDLLKREQRLPIARALPIVLELADALSRAHHLQIIHRDIKPENVLLAPDGTPRLADFGLAQTGEQRITATGTLLGTVAYLSPEALRGQSLDERADIWGLGVMLFEMLTGRQPFESDHAGAMLTAILHQAPPDLRALCPDAPPALIELTYRMLEKDRDQRTSSARQIGAEVEAILGGESSTLSVAPRWGDRGADLPGRASLLPGTVTRPANNLPAQATAFVGREAELGQLASLIANPDVRLITILAAGGMGKSRLAVEAGRRLACGVGTFRELLSSDDVLRRGVFFVDLAPLNSASLIVSALAEAVGFQFYPGSEPRRQLLDYFRGKNLLLLMDNFEHVTADAAIVNEILALAPGIKVLATSRERLGLSRETLFVLEGMGLPDGIEGDAFGSSAAQLFLQSARRVRFGFEGGPEQARQVGRICQLVHGMPLGIVLAASWVGVLAAREIADEISKSLDFLQVDLSDVPERQRSLRVVFEHSWGLLSAEERAAFSRLSVFRGGFTRAAAEAVTGANLHILGALMNKSLLRRDPNSARYEIHELLRQFAGDKLQRVLSDAHDALDRHAEHYAQFLREQADRLKSANQPRALEEIYADVGNVRAAWRWMLERRRLDDVAAAIEGLSLFYGRRASSLEVEGAFGGVVEAFTTSGHEPTGGVRSIISLALSLQAACSHDQGDYERARELVTRAITLSDDTAQRRERAFALVTAASVLTGKESEHQLTTWADEGLALYRAIDDRWDLAQALVTVNEMYLGHENLAKMEATLLESIALQRSLGGGTVLMPFSLVLLGYARAFRGYGEEGLRLLVDGLVIAEKLGERTSIERGLIFLAQVQGSLADHGSAEGSLRRCLALCHESGNRRAETWARIVLGDVLKDVGRIGEAALEYQACLEGRAVGVAQQKLGDIALMRGQFAEAKRLLTESLRWFEHGAVRWGVIQALQSLGYLACEEGEYRLALEHFVRAFQAAATVKASRFVGSTVAGVALVLTRTGQPRLALELLGFAKHQVATEYFTHQRHIEPLLSQVSSQLSEGEVLAAVERGKALDIDVVLRDVSL